jgi:hypothetical protein
VNVWTFEPLLVMLRELWIHHAPPKFLESVLVYPSAFGSWLRSCEVPPNKVLSIIYLDRLAKLNYLIKIPHLLLAYIPRIKNILFTSSHRPNLRERPLVLVRRGLSMNSSFQPTPKDLEEAALCNYAAGKLCSTIVLSSGHGLRSVFLIASGRPNGEHWNLSVLKCYFVYWYTFFLALASSSWSMTTSFRSATK